MKPILNHLCVQGLVEYFLHHHYKEDGEKRLDYFTFTGNDIHAVTFHWTWHIDKHDEDSRTGDTIRFTNFDQFENDCRELFERVMKFEIERELIQDEKYNHERGVGYGG